MECILNLDEYRDLKDSFRENPEKTTHSNERNEAGTNHNVKEEGVQQNRKYDYIMNNTISEINPNILIQTNENDEFDHGLQYFHLLTDEQDNYNDESYINNQQPDSDHPPSPIEPPLHIPQLPNYHHNYIQLYIPQQHFAILPQSMKKSIETSIGNEKKGVAKPVHKKQIQFRSKTRAKSQYKPKNRVAAKACHLCQLKPESMSTVVVVCANLSRGACRKVICKLCFIKNGWDYNKASQLMHNNDQNHDDSENTNERVPDEEWICPHCRDECPIDALCRKWKRN
uniref:Zinc-finger domain-containing protein n=1 Tax=Timspurckia oligopyrenoides TaxID=708627 RepID=A0A7S0ZB36_9RHOD|mmetsp:Transcript_10819/g.19572  ORF Transcript_10819/g.19572 Transcript_10819/m.19572 type:complete len:284 (+) Transcript_10819:103-954(+)